MRDKTYMKAKRENKTHLDKHIKKTPSLVLLEGDTHKVTPGTEVIEDEHHKEKRKKGYI